MGKKIEFHESKPWLAKDGTALTTSELKIVSKKWNQATWERYLRTLEFEENPEIVVRTGIPHAEEKKFPTLSDLLPDHKKLSDDFVGKIESALSSRKIDEREHIILLSIFWEGSSEREISAILGVNRTVVRKIKKRALKKLNRILENKIALPDAEIEPQGGAQSPYLYEEGEK